MFRLIISGAVYVSLCHGIGHALVDGTHLAHHDNDIAGDIGTVNDHFAAAVEQIDHDANDPSAEKDHLDDEQDYHNINYEFEHEHTVDGTLR